MTNMGPEEAALDKMVEADIDDWKERIHLTEVPLLFEGLGEPDVE